jgi:hypothetical protein
MEIVKKSFDEQRAAILFSADWRATRLDGAEMPVIDAGTGEVDESSSMPALTASPLQRQYGDIGNTQACTTMPIEAYQP